MSATTSIEWVRSQDGTPGATWNPASGCTKVSTGCDHCYAETIANRFAGSKAFPNGFNVTLHPDRLTIPLRRRKPTTYFVNSMSDLFHDDVPDEYIARVFAVMAATPQHTYQILTKRHGRMRSLLSRETFAELVLEWGRATMRAQGVRGVIEQAWPLPNVWLGVSAEDQKRTDLRIPALLETPAAVRFISAEPLLGPIELPDHVIAGTADCPCEDGADCPPNIDWVIVGGESGPGARPMHPAWVRSLRDQCTTGGISFFMKQWGAWCPPHEDFGQSIHDHVTNEDTCQVVSLAGQLLGRPWPGWRRQHPDAYVMRRYPKSKAGHILDGRTWDEMPGRDA